MKYLIPLFFYLTSCQSLPVSSGLSEDVPLVYPQEIYRQEISVWIKKDDQKMSFSGALKKNPKSFSLFAFTSLGLRIFTLKDDNNGRIEFVSHVAALDDKKDFILKLYPVIKKIFTLRLNDPNYIKRKFDYKIENPIGQVEVEIDSTGSNILVIKPNYFEFKMKNLDDKSD